MKRHNAIPVGQLIRQFIEASGSAATYDAQRICYLWPEAVGPTINRFTTARWVDRDTLHVTIASGAVKSELTFMSAAIVDRLNSLAGSPPASPIITRLIIH